MKVRFPVHLLAFILATDFLIEAAHADYAGKEDKDISADIQRFCPSSKGYDAEFVAEHVYKPYLDLFGMNRDQAKKLGSAEMQVAAAHGIKWVSCEPVLPYEHFTTYANDYVLVILHEEVWIGLNYYECTDPLLAIRPHGNTKWEYLSLGNRDPKLTTRLFPDLKDRELPTRTWKKIL